jgi:glycosyltransferase involved in cell wall biosynthesis
LIEAEQTGLLVAAGDRGGLARAILRLLTDPVLAARLGSAAQHAVRSRHALDAMLTEYQQFYASRLP